MPLNELIDKKISIGSLINFFVVIVGFIFGAAYFSAEVRSTTMHDRAMAEAQRQRITGLTEEANRTGNRLSIVETDIRYIRDSLVRIERAVIPNRR